MSKSLQQIVESTTLNTDEIGSHTRQIHAAVLKDSSYLDEANFTCIHPADLELLFHQYDEHFFEGQITAALGDTPLHFRLSKRMTSAGGKTTHYKRKHDSWFEISASTTLLFQCFAGDDHRPIVNSGIECRDRLEALQRVMEHELVHLIEKLLWDDSSCAKPRFQSIAQRFFGHTEHTHQLITPREKAFAKFGIKRGDRVRFRFDDVERTGIVNRITRRATVLVEDSHGERYSDGKRYKKYYVPVQLLQSVD